MRKIHKYHEHVGNRCTWWFIHVGGFIYEKGSHFIIHFGHFFFIWKVLLFEYPFFFMFSTSHVVVHVYLLFTSQTLSDFICNPPLNLNINDSIEFFFAHFSFICGYIASKTTVYLDPVAVFHIDLVLFMATVNPCTINFCTYWFDFQMATIEYSYHIRYNIVPHIECRWLGSQVGFFQ